MKYLTIIFLLFSLSLSATQRGEAILIGDTFVREHWSCSAANTTGASQSCPSGYSSYYSVGNYIGVPYKWGGFDSIAQFRDKISQGYGAGSYSSDGVLACVTGVDCSGYVSRCWEQTTKYGTSTIQGISYELGSTGEMKKGDAFNKAGTHIVMLAYYHRDGSPVIMEAAGGDYRKAVFRKVTWSYLNGYVPIRFDSISEDTNVTGTVSNPEIIDSFPYFHSGNTRNMNSLEIDSYSAKPETMETGPEVIYQFTVSTSGTVDISVTDNQSEGIDNDIHLLTTLNVDGSGMATDALARDDHNIVMHIDAGTYYIVVDSFSSSGVDKPGEYTMSASFEHDPVIETDDDNEIPDVGVDQSVTPDDEITDNSEQPDNNSGNDDPVTPDDENVVSDNESSSDDAQSVDDTEKTEDDHENVSEKSSGCSLSVL
ncbi:MAG TPA: hypothetical protein PLG63_05240 [bacterium]|nr:hypothetical protein [bacterium]